MQDKVTHSNNYQQAADLVTKQKQEKKDPYGGSSHSLDILLTLPIVVATPP